MPYSPDDLTTATEYEDPADAGGFQLAGPDLVHQTEPVSAGPFDLPEVRNWTRRQGPNTGRRDVFAEIGAYVRDPQTGQATVTERELARNLGVERKTVIRRIAILEQFGFLTQAHIRDALGHIISTTYTLAGVDSQWQPTAEIGDEDVSTDAYRQRQDRNLLHQQIEALAAQVKELGGVPAVEIPKWDRIERPHTQTHPYVPFWDVGTSPPPPSLSAKTISNDLSVTPAPKSPSPESAIVAFCRRYYDDYIAPGKVKGEKGLNHIGGAMRTFLENPIEFERWQRIVAREIARSDEQVASEYGAGNPVVTGDPDPQAEQVLAKIVDELAEHLPRPTTETWLLPLVGHRLSDTELVIVCPTQFVAEWIEQRIYQAVQKAAEKVLGRPVDLVLALREGWNNAEEEE